MRQSRAAITVSNDAGALLARWIDKSVSISTREPRPSKLPSTATAVLSLLDEIIATEFLLIEDAETYSVLGTISRWWHPLEFPPEVKSALEGIVRKLTSAIIGRARKGQRSEALVTRLQQAMGPTRQVKVALESIAEAETAAHKVSRGRSGAQPRPRFGRRTW